MTVLEDRLVERSMTFGIPLSVHVDLTMRCNERCVHCYRVVEDRAELTTGEIETLLEDLARAGTLYLMFSGGEIFLRQDLFELIAHAKRLRFDVRLKTNALLVTEERARRLRVVGVRHVDVSIYSADPKVHDAITLVPGSLERSIAGIERLRDVGLRVKINCPLMAPTIAGYRDIVTLAQRLGVLHGFDPMITARNDGDRRPVRLRVGRAALARIVRDPLVNPAAAQLAAQRLAPPVPPTPREDLDEVTCSAGHTFCSISAYGDVMPCVAMPLACGNIREQPFAEIWSGSMKLKQVRAIRIRNLHTCSTCEASAFCTRCPGQALVEDGDLYGPSRASCEHTAVRAEIAGSSAIPAGLASI